MSHDSNALEELLTKRQREIVPSNLDTSDVVEIGGVEGSGKKFRYLGKSTYRK